MSRNEICIISGMAIGIDGVAHDVALEKEGKTIAILGGGFNHIYPKENEWLFYKIIENGGCVISEYSPDTRVEKRNFPDRNRLISGLSDAVLIVEATYRSGSSITARYANLQGKEVFAIPNSIYENTGIGTNILIRNGAILTTKPKQIIDEIKGIGSYQINVREEKSVVKEVKKIEEKSLIMNKEYLQIYRVLSNKVMHVNEIADKLKKSIQEITPIITMMEIEGYITQVRINYFKIKEDEV